MFATAPATARPARSSRGRDPRRGWVCPFIASRLAGNFYIHNGDDATAPDFYKSQPDGSSHAAAITGFASVDGLGSPSTRCRTINCLKDRLVVLPQLFDAFRLKFE